MCTHTRDVICRVCGIRTFKDSVAYKHPMLTSIPQSVNLKLMDISTTMNPIYWNIRDSIISVIDTYILRMNLSQNTFYLAVHYMDQSSELLDHYSHKLMAAVCIFVAAKSIEHDIKIPFISQLQTYTELPNVASEYRSAECKLLQKLQWKLQVPTLLEQVQTILSLGALFSTDQFRQDGQISIINENQLIQVSDKFNSQYPSIVKAVVINTNLIILNTPILALAIVLYMRKLNDLHPIYPQQLKTFISSELNTQLLSTFETLCMHLDPTFAVVYHKPCILMASPGQLTQCRSLPPVQRHPLKIITNGTAIKPKPKIIYSKHIEREQGICPLRKNKHQ